MSSLPVRRPDTPMVNYRPRSPGSFRIPQKTQGDFIASFGGNRLVLVGLGVLIVLFAIVLAFTTPAPRSGTVERGRSLIEYAPPGTDSQKALWAINVADQSGRPIFAGRGADRHRVNAEEARVIARRPHGTDVTLIDVPVQPGAQFEKGAGIFSRWRFITPH